MKLKLIKLFTWLRLQLAQPGCSRMHVNCVCVGDPAAIWQTAAWPPGLWNISDLNCMLVWSAGDIIMELRGYWYRVWPCWWPLLHTAHRTVQKSTALCHSTGTEGHTSWWQSYVSVSRWITKIQGVHSSPLSKLTPGKRQDRNWVAFNCCLDGCTRDGREEEYPEREKEWNGSRSSLEATHPFKSITNLYHQDGQEFWGIISWSAL